jgi:hypothetical protein
MRVVDHLADVIQAGLVGEHVPDADRLLARLSELGPVAGDGVLVVDEAAVHQDVEDRGGHALRRREARRHGVGEPRSARRVPLTAPEIRDATTFVIHADGGTARVALQLLAQSRSDLREVRVDESVHA